MTLKPLLIVGAGGLAREALELVAAINDSVPEWHVTGVLDDDEALWGQRVHGIEIIGPAEAAHDHPEALVTACVASPRNPGGRLALTERLHLPRDRYATLVHPAATLARSATLGRGCIVHATAVLTADIVVGDHVAMMPAVVLTHDDRIGDGVTFGAGVRVAGGVRIGEAAYLGAGALLRENVAIGAGALVGMGAVVTRSVPAGETWAGVPAQPLPSADREAALQ